MILDFRFSFRLLGKSPGFTVIAVVTLALAIGVNSAIFALINGVVLRPMVPVRPQEVVNVFTARQSAHHDYRQFSYTEFRELREHGQEIFADCRARVRGRWNWQRSRDATQLRSSDFGKFLLADGLSAVSRPVLQRLGMPAK